MGTPLIKWWKDTRDNTIYELITLANLLWEPFTAVMILKDHKSGMNSVSPFMGDKNNYLIPCPHNEIPENKDDQLCHDHQDLEQ